MTSHVFAIAGYGESPYLDECIESLCAQTLPTRIVLCAGSGGSAFLDSAARRHGIELIRNRIGRGISADWNFALTSTTASRVTVAHQDDVYDKGYAASVSAAFEKVPDAAIVFTNHTEHDPSGLRASSLNLRVKQWMCRHSFSDELAIRAPEAKSRLLRLGNPICCPSVTFNRQIIPDFRFLDTFEIDLDWDAWARLAKLPNAFAYIADPLVSHRVHPETETSAGIRDRRRLLEDARMFQRFWPMTIARLLSMVYRVSYLGNRTGNQG